MFSSDKVIRQTLSNIIYGGLQEYNSYLEFKDIFLNNPNLQIPPQYHTMKLQDQINHRITQQKTLQQLVKPQYFLYLQEFLGMEAARPFQLQGFYNFLLKTMKLKIEKFEFGSVLFGEFDFNRKEQIHQNIQTYINNDRITTPNFIFKSGLYYSGPLTQKAIVLCKSNDSYYMALIRIRNDKGELLNGIEEKWLGKSLSLTNNYCIGIKDVQVLAKHKISLDFALALESYQILFDSQYALRDLFRACYICIKYSKMRSQFNQKIFDYQTTQVRQIVPLGFCMIQMESLRILINNNLSDLRRQKSRVTMNLKFIKLYSGFIFEKSMKFVEDLRESIGGYGYLRFSGIPMIQERMGWFYSQYTKNLVQDSQDLINLFIGSNVKDDFILQKFVQHFLGIARNINYKDMFRDVGDLNEEKLKNYFKVYGYFLAKQNQGMVNVSNNLKQLQNPQLCQQYGFRCAYIYSLQQFHNLMTFQVSQASNLVFKFLSLQFMIVLLEHEDKSSNIELFKKGIGQKLEELKDDVDIVLDALMFDNTFRDCLIGEHNENEFYQKLFDLSKNKNLRNQLLQEQHSRL